MNRLCWSTVLASLLACGGSSEDAPGDPGVEQPASAIALNACQVLSGLDLTGLVGAAPDTIMSVLESSQDGVTVSQCAASFSAPYRTLGLLLRADERGANPTSRQEWVNLMTSGQLGADPAVANAATAVPAVGDLAFLYDMDGANLAAFWKGNHQLIATSFGFADPVARPAVEAIARRAVERY